MEVKFEMADNSSGYISVFCLRPQFFFLHDTFLLIPRLFVGSILFDSIPEWAQLNQQY